MADILRDVIARNRTGDAVAIPSVCSAHPDVLRASILRATVLDQPLVIEATSNQVNQDGGYTGMKPTDFQQFVNRIADEVGVRRDQIVLGGDHLGPQAWRTLPAKVAMAKAREMVAGYVAAGFTKIHLDCSEGCAGEPNQLDDETAASRAADLAAVCVESTEQPEQLLFVIGTEVPPPGGALTDEHGDISATTADAAQATLNAHRTAFLAANLAHVWQQVSGLVVQPGVEFSPMKVHDLPLGRDPGYRGVLQKWPGICLEAHSTDYQDPSVFPRLARLGFAFQKVGPALTFAWREAVYELNTLRGHAGWQTGPDVPDVLERLMLSHPEHWRGHYQGNAETLTEMRHTGLSDRIRYYWPQPKAQAAVAALFTDLIGKPLSVPLLARHFPAAMIDRAEMIAMDTKSALAPALVTASVQFALDPYFIGATDAARSGGSDAV